MLYVNWAHCDKPQLLLQDLWGRSSAKEVMPMVQILLGVVIGTVANVLAALILKLIERKK